MLRYYYHQSFFFFFFSHARMCVSLSSQRSSCISVWFVARDDNACVAEPASRFERSSPSEVDPPYNVAYIRIYYSPRHSLDRTDPQFPWRGTVEPSLLSRMLTARRTFHRSGSLLSHHPSNLLSVLNRGRMIA